uniref:Uncharacterized protein n=1 Tax=Nannochloropsis gaditana (strain CCMP526) TaxID=1093141 RepID=I2CPK7_NANGC
MLSISSSGSEGEAVSATLDAALLALFSPCCFCLLLFKIKLLVFGWAPSSP